MTDVLIKKWCIPECCMDCDPDFAYAIKCEAYNENNDFTRQRAENCPLVEIKHSQDGDTISRADAIEAILNRLQSLESYASDVYRRGLYEAQDIIEALPSAEALQAEPTHGRLIDADALEKELSKRWDISDDQDFCNKEVWDALRNAPTVQADRPHGEWIEREDWNGDSYYDCSVCGESFFLCDGTPSMNLYHYCPNCGADMRGGGDDGKTKTSV